MTGFEVAVIASTAMTIGVIVVLVITRLKFAARIKSMTADYDALEAKFTALREQNQRELLALGQRVLEADKIVRRFSERLDAIENNHTPDQPQYGQLQALLAKTAREGDASAAEVELLSLLTRTRKVSS